MKCFGEFHNDRTCGLCKKVDREMYSSCKFQYESAQKLQYIMNTIKNKCPYREQAITDEWMYYKCTRPGYGIDGECWVTMACADGIEGLDFSEALKEDEE